MVPLLELLELLPAHEKPRNLGSAARAGWASSNGPPTPAWPWSRRGSRPRRFSFDGGEAITGLGDLLDCGDVGLHRGDLTLHSSDVGISGRGGGGGELGGGEDRPEQGDAEREGESELDLAAHPDPAKAGPVMEENVARLEDVAELTSESRIVALH